MEYMSGSTEQTERIAARFAATLSPGVIVALRGPLGAGKTAFVRGMAAGLGVRGRVTSPTYTIVNEYYGEPSLFHFDLYRISGEQELFDLGWQDYLDRGGICAVEWFERAFPDGYNGAVTVELIRIDDDTRQIIITGI